MNKHMVTLAIAATLVVTSHAPSKADDGYNYSQWASRVYPIFSGRFAEAWTHERSGPWEGEVSWFKGEGDYAFPPGGNTWMRVRVRCYADYISTIERYEGLGAWVHATSHWVGPDATGRGDNPPFSWVRCPQEKPYAFNAQAQVASQAFAGFAYVHY